MKLTNFRDTLTPNGDRLLQWDIEVPTRWGDGVETKTYSAINCKRVGNPKMWLVGFGQYPESLRFGRGSIDNAPLNDVAAAVFVQMRIEEDAEAYEWARRASLIYEKFKDSVEDQRSWVPELHLYNMDREDFLTIAKKIRDLLTAIEMA